MKILIADDHGLLRDTLAMFLEGEDNIETVTTSDFDGAMMPKDLPNVLGMKKLINLMTDQGFSKELMNKLCHQNLIHLVKRTLS